MPTHSLDLRQRIVAAYQAGGTSIREVAKRFMVTKRTVHRLVQQYKQTQDLTPKKVGTKRVGILEQNKVAILAIVEEYPDKCLWQYVEIIGERLGIHVSISTLHSFLKKHKITLKKKTFRSEKAKSEVVQEQRLGYWHKIGSVPAEDIVAVDETATWEGMERKVAWSLQGKKVYSYRQKNKGQKHTLIGAISVEGVVCYKIIKGSMKKRDFLEFVKTELCPKLNEKKVVIMDNLNSHKAIEVQQMISQTGARLLYLPVYSPEFNPIEMMWSVLKNFIRQFHDSPVKNIQSIIQASLLLINPSSFANWFTKCCYCTP